MQDVMECYRKLFLKNNMPAEMVDDQLISIEAQMKTIPIISLRAVSAQLKTQL
jgi:hypothetical protein